MAGEVSVEKTVVTDIDIAVEVEVSYGPSRLVHDDTDRRVAAYIMIIEHAVAVRVGADLAQGHRPATVSPGPGRRADFVPFERAAERVAVADGGTAAGSAVVTSRCSVGDTAVSIPNRARCRRAGLQQIGSGQAGCEQTEQFQPESAAHRSPLFPEIARFATPYESASQVGGAASHKNGGGGIATLPRRPCL